MPGTSQPATREEKESFVLCRVAYFGCACVSRGCLAPPTNLTSPVTATVTPVSSTMTIWLDLELDRTCAVVTQRSNICGMPRASEVENAGVHVCMTVESVRSASTKQEPVFVIPRPEEPIFFNLPAQTHISYLTKAHNKRLAGGTPSSTPPPRRRMA
jgi:hypothetical protein